MYIEPFISNYLLELDFYLLAHHNLYIVFIYPSCDGFGTMTPWKIFLYLKINSCQPPSQKTSSASLDPIILMLFPSQISSQYLLPSFAVTWSTGFIPSSRELLSMKYTWCSNLVDGTILLQLSIPKTLDFRFFFPRRAFLANSLLTFHLPSYVIYNNKIERMYYLYLIPNMWQ